MHFLIMKMNINEERLIWFNDLMGQGRAVK